MAVALSIGSRVSFFYHIPAQQHSAVSPLAHLTAANCYALKLSGTVLTLHSRQPLALATTDAFAADAAPGAAVIRLFGAVLDWQLVHAVLQLVAPDNAVLCRVYKPHPQLDGALELQLTQPLSAQQQQQLAEYVVKPGVELVYLPLRIGLGW